MIVRDRTGLFPSILFECYDVVDKNNEGKLIATHGKLINEDTLTDEVFKVSIKTPKLVRTVEMYQWKEEEHTEDDDDNTTYTYEKVWSESLIDSSSFHQSGHDNPASMQYVSNTLLAGYVKVGAFVLNGSQVEQLSTNGTYTELSEEVATSLDYRISGNYYINSADLNTPAIGDMRVSFSYNNSTDISVLAVQIGESFTDYVSSVGKTESKLMDGIHSGKEMIEVIKKENNILKWILRGVGVIMMSIGFATILKPISTISGYVPILGSIVQGAVGLVSFVLGLAISLVVIAIAWIRFRPLIGIGLLVVVVALIVFLKKRSKDKKAAMQTTEQPTVETSQQVPTETQTMTETPQPIVNDGNPEVTQTPSVPEEPPANNDNNQTM